GSLQELIDDLNVCIDEDYVPAHEVVGAKQQGWHVLKLLNGYLRWLRECKSGQTQALHENPPPYGDSDEDLEFWLASLPL
ncbi:MAG: hypothetical protein NTX51_18695, partial [Verrucomicrobia bacterium]|nr:hypothetical protein [Verrucomicrobiota bacterium]